jgi:heparin/heparan-sulfate lyase
LRQVVFVPPDTFVVCDRVTSTKPDYAKAWLLHTQNEPVVKGAVFRADEDQGRLFCRTLFPKQAALTKIGGPGKAFWANGINWELNDAVKRMNDKQIKRTGKPMLLGNWRVEVSPASARTDDMFLHVIHVGDQTLTRMPDCQLLQKANAIGVHVRLPDKTARLMFGTSGKASGQVEIMTHGKAAVAKNLTGQVQPQTGLAAK